jgi:hypothetical protein
MELTNIASNQVNHIVQDCEAQLLTKDINTWWLMHAREYHRWKSGYLPLLQPITKTRTRNNVACLHEVETQRRHNRLVNTRTRRFTL